MNRYLLAAIVYTLFTLNIAHAGRGEDEAYAFLAKLCDEKKIRFIGNEYTIKKGRFFLNNSQGEYAASINSFMDVSMEFEQWEQLDVDEQEEFIYTLKLHTEVEYNYIQSDRLAGKYVGAGTNPKKLIKFSIPRPSSEALPSNNTTRNSNITNRVRRDYIH